MMELLRRDLADTMSENPLSPSAITQM